MSMKSSKSGGVWKSAQLYIGFHRNPEGKRRDKPHVWSPKNGAATIHREPNEQETFVELKSAEGDSAQDIQIKLRPDMIVLRRDVKHSWEGIKVDACTVSVKVAGVLIRIDHDGTIAREDGDNTTWIEADGSVLKKNEFVEASMSSDGVELTRRTPDNFAAITQHGVLSKDR